MKINNPEIKADVIIRNVLLISMFFLFFKFLAGRKTNWAILEALGCMYTFYFASKFLALLWFIFEG